jgi:hypothetical protein
VRQVAHRHLLHKRFNAWILTFFAVATSMVFSLVFPAFELTTPQSDSTFSPLSGWGQCWKTAGERLRIEPYGAPFQTGGKVQSIVAKLHDGELSVVLSVLSHAWLTFQQTRGGE